MVDTPLDIVVGNVMVVATQVVVALSSFDGLDVAGF